MKYLPDYNLVAWTKVQNGKNGEKIVFNLNISDLHFAL